jgi:dihydropteroate synthase
MLSGLSRKSFVGRAMTPPMEPIPEPKDRLAGTLILSLMHVRCGASILRVHDVKAHREVVRVAGEM